MKNPDGIEICSARNHAPGHRWDYCSLAPGHAGEHRAHESYDTGMAYDAWPNNEPPRAPAPTPIDPARLTLAAAALQGLLAAGWKLEDETIREAVWAADATLAALRKEEA